MNLYDITPLVLTFNEEANIKRSLDRLRWASRIVVMDSGSTDRTLAICEEFSNVEVIHRAFDSFAGQCNSGLNHISSEWVLSMDADYVFPVNFSKVLESLDGGTHIQGYCLPFRYCIHGNPLRSCLYPPRTVLYQREKATYYNDGHGHRVEIEGSIAYLPVPIDHDDRKPLSHWLESQRKYAAMEAEKMAFQGEVSGFPDRLRKLIWPAAPAAFLYTLFGKMLILNGWSGIFYSLQRTYAELLLSLELLDLRLSRQRTSVIKTGRKSDFLG